MGRARTPEPSRTPKPSCTIPIPRFRGRGRVIPRFPRFIPDIPPDIPPGFRHPPAARPVQARRGPPQAGFGAGASGAPARSRACGRPVYGPVGRSGTGGGRARPEPVGDPVDGRWASRRRFRYGPGSGDRGPRRVRYAGPLAKPAIAEGRGGARRRIRCAATPNPMRESPESPQNPMRLHAESDADPRRAVCATTPQVFAASAEFVPPYNPHN